jgi:multidrug efflux pump subunit AcrB
MRIVKFFVNNPQFSLLLFLFTLGVGLSALLTMPRGEDPPFGAPIFIVTAVYPGTSPADMEQLIADPLEDELYNIDDIDFIKTNISDGLMVMRIEFEYGVDVDNKNNEVIREVNRLRPELPANLALLDIERAASSDVVVLQAAITGRTASDQTLIDVAEELERRLERVPGTKWVRVQAEPEQEIRVHLDLERMTNYGIGFDRVLATMESNNRNIPGGSIDLGARRFSVQTDTDYETVASIRETVVSTGPNGGLIRLGDIATVRRMAKEDAYRARYNGERAVWVLHALQNSANIVAARQDMQVVLDEFRPTLADGLQLHVAFDQEASVTHRLKSLGRDFLIAVFLVLLTLLPLGPRASLVVMISIPLSLSIGLALLYYLGYTLNQLSIVGLVVALGLVVDDSIVMVENIERYLRMGYSRLQAAVAASKQIGVAVVGCTIVLLLAFLPLAFLPGGAGEFIRSLPMAVLMTVSASLFVAITITPFLASRLLKAHEREGGNIFLQAFHRYINAPYQRILLWGFRRPALALLGAGLIFGASLLLIPRLGFGLFPDSERPMFTVEIESTPGSSLNETDRLARRVEQYLLQRPEIESVSTNVGKGNPRVYYNTIQQPFSPGYAQLFVQLKERLPLDELVAYTSELGNVLRQVPGARVEVKRFAQGPPIEAPIEYRIIGPDLDTLSTLANRVEDILRQTPGTEYVRNNLRIPRTDLALELDREKAGLYGLTPVAVAQTVRLGVTGLPGGTLREADGEEYPVVVSLGQPVRSSALQTFDRLHVTSATGSMVPVRQVADLTARKSPPNIQHYNKERYTAVTAFPQAGYNTAALMGQISEELAGIPLPPGYRFVAAGEAESAERSFSGMGAIIMLALFGILAVLVLEFRTFKSTIIVLSVVPLGIVGALVSLYLNGLTLSFVSTIGMIALVGIEIKNSILFVDYTNQQREAGIPLREAVLDGAETRFLPILLTALTAIGGLTPLALENNPLVSPLAWVLIGGLISSTLLSRVVTPVLYLLLPPAVKTNEN